MKIPAIKTNNSYSIYTRKINNNQYINKTNNTDTISFHGADVPFDYSDEDVLIARQSLYLDDISEWQNFAYKNKKDILWNDIESLFEIDLKDEFNGMRMMFAMCTLGLSEGIYYTGKHFTTKFKAKKNVNKINELRNEMLKAKEAEDKAQEEKIKQSQKNLKEIQQSTNEIKNEEKIVIFGTPIAKSLYILNANDAKERLNNEEYKKETPIAAINDILYILGAEDEESFLTFDVLPDDLTKTKETIENLSGENNSYIELFDKLATNIWYCKNVEITTPLSRATNNFTSSIAKEEEKKYGLNKVLGMEKLKEELISSLIAPQKDTSYQEYGIENVNGVLLYGPPGCGKTFIIEAIAEEMDRYFIQIKPSDVSSSYMNATSHNIAEKFNEAKNHSPSLVFIDEIEALAPNRDSLDGQSTGVDVNNTVNELLTQFNEAKKHDIIIISASNEPQRIDKAIKRSGRLDKKIFVPQPDAETRKAFINNRLDKISKKTDDIDVNLIAENTEYYTAEDIKLLIRNAALKALKNKKLLDTNDIMEAIKEYKTDLNSTIVEKYRKKGENL